VTEKLGPLRASNSLLHSAVYHVWPTQRPCTTVAQWEATLAKAVQVLTEAQTWDTPRWQQERDTASETALAEAIENNVRNASLRQRLERQIELVQKLLGFNTDNEARADCEQLIRWLNNEIERAALRVDLPTKKASLANFKRKHLLQLASRVKNAQNMVKVTRENWEAYDADQASIARVQAALRTLTTAPIES